MSPHDGDGGPASDPKELTLKPVAHVLVSLVDDKKAGRVKKHHLLIFEVPEGYGLWRPLIKCSLFNWTPTHGGVRQWRWIGPLPLCEKDRSLLLYGKMGLLVPRLFWDYLYRKRSEAEKLEAFRVDCLEASQACLSAIDDLSTSRR